MVRPASVLLAFLALAAPATAAPDPAKVGMATDLGGLNDRSFNSLTLKGLEAAEAAHGVTGTALESKSYADHERNLRSLATSDHGLVFGIGFLMGDAVKDVAAEASETKFAIVDYSYADGRGRWGATGNVTGILFHERQAGYLAGALVGAAEQNRALANMNRAKVVGMVGGQQIPPVTAYMGGFKAGVLRTCRTCRVPTSYSNDFIDQRKCRARARTQFAQGSDVVFVVAGGCGLGAHAEAKARGLWSVGVDADQAYLGRHVITSAVKRVDVATADVIRQHVEGTLPGGRTILYGLSRNGVGIGAITPSARRFQFAVAAARRDLLAGRVR